MTGATSGAGAAYRVGQQSSPRVICGNRVSQLLVFFA